MLKLKRLKIIKFRHVEPTELVFDDRYTVPLGINGSGKTTLLNLISACLRSDFSAYKEEELDVEYEVQAVDARFRVAVTSARLASEMPVTHSEVDAGLRAAFSRPAWRSWAQIYIRLPDGHEATISVRKQGLRVSFRELSANLQDENRVPTPAEGSFLFQALARTFRWLQYEVDGISFQEPSDVLLELLDAGECHRFDESLTTLNSITAPPATEASDALLVPHLEFEFIGDDVDVGPWGVSGHARSFVPAVLANEVDREFEASAKAPGAEPSADVKFILDLPFIKTFVAATSFAKGAMVLEAIEKKASWARQGPEIKIRLGHFGFRFYTKGGDAIMHELLSYGQKRLLSFLYYVACNNVFIVADELINGLHHAWIEVCLDAIGERQAFLTSQNPILLDFLPPTSPEEAQRRFIRCVPDERAGRDVMVWRNLTPDEATELCANYAAGVQQLSDLLRIQGLW